MKRDSGNAVAIAGLIVAAIGILVSSVDNDVSLAAQEDHQTDDVRSETYLEYASSYNEFALAADELAIEIESCESSLRNEPGFTPGTQDGFLRAIECRLLRTDTYVAARRRYRDARTAVQVHGSAAANEAADSMSRVLPPSRNVRVRLDVAGTPELNFVMFEAADAQFTRIMCGELQTEPAQCNERPA